MELENLQTLESKFGVDNQKMSNNFKNLSLSPQKKKRFSNIENELKKNPDEIIYKSPSYRFNSKSSYNNKISKYEVNFEEKPEVLDSIKTNLENKGMIEPKGKKSSQEYKLSRNATHGVNKNREKLRKQIAEFDLQLQNKEIIPQKTNGDKTEVEYKFHRANQIKKHRMKGLELNSPHLSKLSTLEENKEFEKKKKTMKN